MFDIKQTTNTATLNTWTLTESSSNPPVFPSLPLHLHPSSSLRVMSEAIISVSRAGGPIYSDYRLIAEGYEEPMGFFGLAVWPSPNGPSGTVSRPWWWLKELVGSPPSSLHPSYKPPRCRPSLLRSLRRGQRGRRLLPRGRVTWCRKKHSSFRILHFDVLSLEYFPIMLLSGCMWHCGVHYSW